MQQWKEMGNHKYQPLGIKFDGNGCDVLGSNSGVAFQVAEYIMPTFRTLFQDTLHSCPYYPGRLEVFNITVPDAFFESSILKGKMKGTLRYFNGKNQTLYALSVFYISS
jgi:hypothetical protein